MRIGYKGFEEKNGKLYCRDMEYKVGEIAEVPGKPKKKSRRQGNEKALPRLSTLQTRKERTNKRKILVRING